MSNLNTNIRPTESMGESLENQAGQAQAALDRVCEMLLAGQVSPGQRVSEKALARQLGMSIIPVREALAHLIAMGVLVKVPHYGTFAQQLGPEGVSQFADFRLMVYSYAIARAAADPEPTALVELQTAAKRFEQQAREAIETNWDSAESSDWQAMLTDVVQAILNVLHAALSVAHMDVQGEIFRQADLLHIMLVRDNWQILTRADLMDHLREAYVERPLWGFVSAIEARDVQRAQRLHFDRAQFAYHDMDRRIQAARGEHGSFPPPRVARLGSARFEFSAP